MPRYFEICLEIHDGIVTVTRFVQTVTGEWNGKHCGNNEFSISFGDSPAVMRLRSFPLLTSHCDSPCCSFLGNAFERSITTGSICACHPNQYETLL
jgi:hypothetical protein